jgi:hypothetical protein
MKTPGQMNPSTPQRRRRKVRDTEFVPIQITFYTIPVQVASRGGN